MYLSETKSDGQDKSLVWDQLFHLLELRHDLESACGALYDAKLVAPDLWVCTFTGRERALMYMLSRIIPKLQRELWLASYKGSGQRSTT